MSNLWEEIGNERQISASVLSGLTQNIQRMLDTNLAVSLCTFILDFFALFLFILETDFICLCVHTWTLGSQKIELDVGSLEREL